MATQGDRIFGLIELVRFIDGSAPSIGPVRPHMRPLSEEMLLGGDAGILTFVRDADRLPFRFVVSGREISGLVSLSDLQRLPVRAVLFAIVTHLEIVMADVIRMEFKATDKWLERLPEGRRNHIYCGIEKAKKADAFVESLLFTQFADKVTIIRKSPHLPLQKEKFKSDLRQIQSLRDNLAHANNYAATRDDARKICATVRLIDKWAEHLACVVSGMSKE